MLPHFSAELQSPEHPPTTFPQNSEWSVSKFSVSPLYCAVSEQVPLQATVWHAGLDSPLVRGTHQTIADHIIVAREAAMAWSNNVKCRLITNQREVAFETFSLFYGIAQICQGIYQAN